MPSPIAHAAAGYLIYRGLSGRFVGFRPGLVWAGIGLSLLPDIDAAAGLLLGDMGRYHNHMTHSLAFALLASFAAGMAGRRLASAFWPWFTLALACYLAHITMDFFTSGRGIMLLWPVSEQRFKPPFSIFYGLHWSDGLFSSRHIWTVVSEIATVAAFALIVAMSRYVTVRLRAKHPDSSSAG